MVSSFFFRPGFFRVIICILYRYCLLLYLIWFLVFYPVLLAFEVGIEVLIPILFLVLASC